MKTLRLLLSPLAVAGLALTLISPTTFAGKAGYYQWRDAEGNVHFTQQPPQVGTDSSFVETRGGAKYQGPDDTESSEASEDSHTTDTAATPPPKNMEVLPPKDPAICAQARANLRSMQNGAARIRMTDTDGNTRMLTMEEKAEQRKRAEDAIKMHCE